MMIQSSFRLKIAGPVRSGPVAHVARKVSPHTSGCNQLRRQAASISAMHRSLVMRNAPSETSGAPQGQVTGALMESMRQKIAEALEVREIDSWS